MLIGLYAPERTPRLNHNLDLLVLQPCTMTLPSEVSESAPSDLHVHISVSHRGNGTRGLDHMANHVDNGKVDDGPVEHKLWSGILTRYPHILYIEDDLMSR